MSDSVSKQEPTGDNNDDQKIEHVNLRVSGSDGGEINFKIKRSTPLSKLMDAYCKKTGVDRNSVRFLFDGSRLQPTDTADAMDLQDDDQIQVVVNQLGGF